MKIRKIFRIILSIATTICIAVFVGPKFLSLLLTWQHGNEMKTAVINYWLVSGKAEAARDPVLLQVVTTGHQLAKLEPLVADNHFDIVTKAEVTEITVLDYSVNSAVISTSGYFTHFTLDPETNERSQDIESPFSQLITLRREIGLWKVEETQPNNVPP